MSEFLRMANGLPRIPEDVLNTLLLISKQANEFKTTNHDPFYIALLSVSNKTGLKPGEAYFGQRDMKPFIILVSSMGSVVFIDSEKHPERATMLILDNPKPGMDSGDNRVRIQDVSHDFLLSHLNYYHKHGENYPQRDLKNFFDDMVRRREIWADRYAGIVPMLGLHM